MCIALGKQDQVSELHCPGRKWIELCGTSIPFLRAITISYTSFSDHDTSIYNHWSGCRLSDAWQVATPYIHRNMLGGTVRKHHFDM